MRESGEEHNHTTCIQSTTILYCIVNDSTGHGVPSAASSGPQSLLFHVRGMGFCVCCL